MDNIVIPASMTLENYTSKKKYKWKSDLEKESNYISKNKRATVRFTCKNFADRLNKLEQSDRKVSLNFVDSNLLIIRRDSNGSVCLQGYTGEHPVVQVCANKAILNTLKEKFGDKTKTIPINISFNLRDWADLEISPEDFLIDVEKHPKSLMKKALDKGFRLNKISRGRMYDLQLINSKNKELIIAISSHTAKNENRSREKRIQKILMDISKMMVYIYEKKDVIPVIISEPIENENSWSYTTKGYLDFYKDKLGFKFITTDFKKGWEDDIITELLKV